MSLLTRGWSRYSFTYDNYGTNPATTPGGLVTAGASINTESATPLVLATGSNIAQDVHWVQIVFHTASGTGDRSILADIGVDPAGGTSYTYVINNIVVGNCGVAANLHKGASFLFPIFIKAGSQVAVRTQCSQASITQRVSAKFFGYPSNPEQAIVGQYSETLGTITNSQGQSFTPGNAGDGGWQSLGSTSRNLWWWQLAYQISNATITAETTFIDLAWGDGSNKHIILRAQHFGGTAENCADLLDANLNPAAAFCPVPAGATIYVRGRCNNSPDTGYNAVAIGIGG